MKTIRELPKVQALTIEQPVQNVVATSYNEGMAASEGNPEFEAGLAEKAKAALRAALASSPPAEMAGVEESEEIELGLQWLRGEIGACDPDRLKAAATAIEAALRTRQDTRAGGAVERDRVREAVDQSAETRGDNRQQDFLRRAMLAVAPATPTGTDDGEGAL